MFEITTGAYVEDHEFINTCINSYAYACTMTYYLFDLSINLIAWFQIEK